MRVIQTIAGTWLHHGGTSRSVPAVCTALAQRGMDVRLITTRPTEPSIAFNVPEPPATSHLVNTSKRFGRARVGRAYQRILAELAQSPHEISVEKTHRNMILHDHGIWLASNHAVARFATRRNVVRVVSPRGMLSDWAISRNRWKKRLAWLAYQGRDIRSATAFHATSEQEVADIRRLGLRQPIAVIPNGFEIPLSLPSRNGLKSPKTILFLSRIHPKKGLINLVRAWKISGVGNDWRLVIAGHDENNHRQTVETEVRQLGIADRVIFAGPYDDTEKWQAYADADVFVLPSFSENFGIVVAEAFAASLPVITTTGTPWTDLDDRGVGWTVPPEMHAMANAIKTATDLPQHARDEMGRRGSSWVRRDFTWKTAASRLELFYEWLFSDAQPPEFVCL